MKIYIPIVGLYTLAWLIVIHLLRSVPRETYVAQPITDDPDTEVNELHEANALWRAKQGLDKKAPKKPSLTLEELKARRKSNTSLWQGADRGPITDDPATEVNELHEANALWRAEQGLDKKAPSQPKPNNWSWWNFF